MKKNVSNVMKRECVIEYPQHIISIVYWEIHKCNGGWKIHPFKARTRGQVVIHIVCIPDPPSHHSWMLGIQKIDTSSHDMLLICVRDQNAFSCFQSLNRYLADDQSNDLRSSSISFSILPTFPAISLLWGFRICLTEGYKSSISL